MKSFKYTSPASVILSRPTRACELKDANKEKTLENHVKSSKINEEQSINFNLGGAVNKYFKDESEFLKKQASQDVRDNIKWYSINEYKDINGMLRGTSTVDEETRSYVNEFRKVMNKHIDEFELKNDITTYRTVEKSVLEKALDNLDSGTGKIFSDKGYMSTSPSKKVIEKFAKKAV